LQCCIVRNVVIHAPLLEMWWSMHHSCLFIALVKYNLPTCEVLNFHLLSSNYNTILFSFFSQQQCLLIWMSILVVFKFEKSVRLCKRSIWHKYIFLSTQDCVLLIFYFKKKSKTDKEIMIVTTIVKMQGTNKKA
jgi:hypothetical protein